MRARAAKEQWRVLMRFSSSRPSNATAGDWRHRLVAGASPALATLPGGMTMRKPCYPEFRRRPKQIRMRTADFVLNPPLATRSLAPLDSGDPHQNINRFSLSWSHTFLIINCYILLLILLTPLDHGFVCFPMHPNTHSQSPRADTPLVLRLLAVQVRARGTTHQ